MFRFLPLASSSKGNSVYLGTETEGILFDAGIGPRSLQSALKLGGIQSVEAIKAIFITHEHSDHIKGLLSLTEKIDVPVYGSRETLVELIHKEAVTPHTQLFEIKRRTVTVADYAVRCFSTSHDSVHSLGYQITLPNGVQAALCTDLGVVTPEVHTILLGCDAVMLESNYDRELLRTGRYPYYLKERIASEHGHLCNDDCAAELVKLIGNGTKQVILGHLSEENNRPELAAKTAIEALTKAGFVIETDYHLLTAPRTTAGQFLTL